MDTIKFEFPPLDQKKQDTVDRLLQTIGELMDVTFKTQQVIIKQVEFDAERADVATTIRRVIATLKNQAIVLKNKPVTPKP